MGPAVGVLGCEFRVLDNHNSAAHLNFVLLRKKNVFMALNALLHTILEKLLGLVYQQL